MFYECIHLQNIIYAIHVNLHVINQDCDAMQLACTLFCHYSYTIIDAMVQKELCNRNPPSLSHNTYLKSIILALRNLGSKLVHNIIALSIGVLRIFFQGGVLGTSWYHEPE